MTCERLVSMHGVEAPEPPDPAAVPVPLPPPAPSEPSFMQALLGVHAATKDAKSAAHNPSRICRMFAMLAKLRRIERCVFLRSAGTAAMLFSQAFSATQPLEAALLASVERQMRMQRHNRLPPLRR